MKRGNGAEFARFLGAFLPVARKAPINYAVVIGMIVAPVVALLTIDDAGSTAFVLTAIGLALIVAGPLAVSNRLGGRARRARLGRRVPGSETFPSHRPRPQRYVDPTLAPGARKEA